MIVGAATHPLAPALAVVLLAAGLVSAQSVGTDLAGIDRKIWKACLFGPGS